MGVVKYTGPVASFHCPTDAEIRHLKVHFSPKQEGTGDPSPENVRPIVGWEGVEVGNYKKNLFDMSVFDNVPGIALGEDGYYQGTVKSFWTAFRSKLPLSGYLTPYTSYIVSFKFYFSDVGDFTNGVLSIRSHFADNTSSNFIIFYPTVLEPQYVCKSLSNSYVHTHLSMYLVDGRGSNYIFHIKDFQIELGSTTANSEPVSNHLVNDYEKYQGKNISYQFGTLGKNKFDYANSNIIDANRRDDNGNEVSDVTGSYTSALTPVSPSTIYTASGFGASSSKRIYYIDSNENFISRTDTIKQNVFTFTTPSNCHYVQFQSGRVEASTWSEVQLELGSTATAYEPYNPNKTIYGGWVDLITGEVCEEYGIMHLDETNNWTGYATTGVKTRVYLDSGANAIASAAYAVVPSVSNKFISQGQNGYPDENKFCFSNTTEGRMFLGLSSSITSLEDFKIWFGNLGGADFAYERIAPITYQLHQTELSTFLGQNNVWSNADYVEVEYDLHETQTILQRKQYILANQPHLVTAQDKLVNFKTDLAAPLKSCKVYFTPVQEGSGDPSPNNVRAISGWTGFEVCKTGKNLFNINANWQNLLSTYKYAKMLPNELCRIRFIPKNLSVDLTGYSLGFVYFEPNSIAQANKGYNWVMENGVIKADNRLHNKVVGGDYSGLYCQYIFVYPGADEALNAITSAYDIEIEPNNLNTNYEPYIGTTLSLNWSSTAGTIYGGYVDLMNGELVTTHGIITLDGTENSYGYKSYWANMITVSKEPVLLKSTNCNILPCVDILAPSIDDRIGVCYAEKRNANLTVIGFGLTESFADKESFINYVQTQYQNGTPIQICGPLETPIHYTLTPTQLKSLKGINNIWSDANGNVEVSYWTH